MRHIRYEETLEIKKNNVQNLVNKALDRKVTVSDAIRYVKTLFLYKHGAISCTEWTKRGKLFLPFVDEDPKTAEIMSKIVMLAEDKKIKDPSILDQIV